MNFPPPTKYIMIALFVILIVEHFSSKLCSFDSTTRCCLIGMFLCRCDKISFFRYILQNSCIVSVCQQNRGSYTIEIPPSKHGFISTSYCVEILMAATASPDKQFQTSFLIIRQSCIMLFTSCSIDAASLSFFSDSERLSHFFLPPASLIMSSRAFRKSGRSSSFDLTWI